MIDQLQAAMRIGGSGLAAQSIRLRVVSENIANSESTGAVPGSNPYARKTVTFSDELDRSSGADLVKVDNVGVDSSPFRVEYDPGNPAADQAGNVKLPNVNVLTEMADLREANQSYEANVQIIKQANTLEAMTIDLLKSS